MKKVVAGSVRRVATVAGLSVVLLAICGAGCRKQAPEAPDANAPSSGQTPQAVAPKDVETPQPDKVMATVNGTSIMESQVRQRVQDKWGAQLEKLAAQSPQLAAQQEKQAMQLAVNELVIEELLDEEAKRAGIDITVDQAIAEITKQLAAENPPVTLEEYKTRLEAQGISFDTMKAFLARNMKYSQLLETKVGDAIQTTEEEARKFYEGNPDEFKVPEQVRASHILISTEPTDASADANQVKAQAREKAERLLKQVKEGADFATVAKENSSCPSAANGGDLGFYPRGEWAKPFEDAAFAMKVGEISDLVETQFGYHIIQVTGHTDPNTITFAAAKDRIIENLKAAKRQKALGNYIESLRQKATIAYAAGDMMPMRPPAAPVQADANQVQTRPEPVAATTDPNKG